MRVTSDNTSILLAALIDDTLRLKEVLSQIYFEAKRLGLVEEILLSPFLSSSQRKTFLSLENSSSISSSSSLFSSVSCVPLSLSTLPPSFDDLCSLVTSLLRSFSVPIVVVLERLDVLVSPTRGQSLLYTLLEVVLITLCTSILGKK